MSIKSFFISLFIASTLTLTGCAYSELVHASRVSYYVSYNSTNSHVSASNRRGYSNYRATTRRSHRGYYNDYRLNPYNVSPYRGNIRNIIKVSTPTGYVCGRFQYSRSTDSYIRYRGNDVEFDGGFIMEYVLVYGVYHINTYDIVPCRW